jgi:hypothetical protein
MMSTIDEQTLAAIAEKEHTPFVVGTKMFIFDDY